jgi:DNA/RNA endonuclease YhcR with UshA esterase domain
MRSVRGMAVLVITLRWAAPSPAEAIRPQDAAKHVSEAAIVEGVVAGVGHSQRSNTTFLNFCEPYPNQCFTAVIFRSARPLFQNPDLWDGKRVRVSGRVRLYRGKPEIVLERPEQIRAMGR